MSESLFINDTDAFIGLKLQTTFEIIYAANI